ncbi:MAG: family 78 glycoside hydrolase catalytic domain [Bacteroidales bacterium]|nr:family 78 glycoside hydrolase catalytic domain [Candidatus Cryptobacteroides faecihippi]
MKRIILSAVAAISVCIAMHASGRNVTDLRCEGLHSPLGIDNTTPHFSWKVNEIQKTYRIQAATTLKALQDGKADLWDSGSVSSDDCVMVPYAGKQLSSRELCWWRVSVNGKDWSEPQRFSVGIISPDVMPGEYVGACGGEAMHSPVVYSTFKTKDAGKTAFLHVNSLGYHEAYVNGHRVSETVLTPAVSQLDKRSLIVTYDVTPFLRKGKNDIAIWMGQGWYNRKGHFKAEYDGPLVKACLDVLSGGEWSTVAYTDSSWKGVESGYSNNSIWYSGQFGGEKVETGRIPECLCAASLDKLGPVGVDVVKVSIPQATPQMCAANILKEVVPAVSIEPAGKDRWIVDMGKVMNAQIEVALKGQAAGDEVRILYSDETQNRGKDQGWGFDEMVCCGDPAKDIFRSKFNHHVFRYAILEGVHERPALGDVKAHRFGACDAKGSSFHSSDPDLDRIHDMVAYTMDNLVFSGYMVDCASIERLGYGGDGNASCLSLQTIYDISPLYMNWLQAWNDTVGEDGHLRHTAPSPISAGGGPYWCSFIVQAPWRVYMASGDTRPLERCYETMKKWLGYVDTYSVDGLLKKWPEDDRRAWYLGDWLAPRGTDVTLEESVDLVNNCALSQSYADLIKIAGILGKAEDEKEFVARKHATDSLINKVFYHEDEGIYGTGSQLDMIYPMLVGATPEGIREQVKAKLFERTRELNGGHLGLGLVGIPVMAEWAALEKEADFVYGMLKKRSYPGYLYMLDNGATATWEDWDNPRSQLHNCFNGIGSWFYQALGGIIQDKPGFKHVRIEPQYPEGLDWVRVSQETPYGTICVSWERKGDEVNLRVDIPSGITATIEGMELGHGSHDLYAKAR